MYRPEIANTAHFVILAPVGMTKATCYHYNPKTGDEIVEAGDGAEYSVVGYAENMSEAQRVVFGRPYTH